MPVELKSKDLICWEISSILVKNWTELYEIFP